MEKINFVSGGTYFDKPLLKALDIMEAYKDRTSKFILCFMTDGACYYPETAI